VNGKLAPVGCEATRYALTWIDARGHLREAEVVGLDELRAQALVVRRAGGTMLRAVDAAGRLALTYYHGD
jgi:hypothetical protein